MEPRIQYAQTADGVSIAFCTLGEGMPFILPATPGFSEIQPTSEFPALLSWLERMAQGRQLVWYDGRGTGLSQRDVVDRSLDARIMDLDAVVNRLGLQRFVLMGRYFAGPVAIAYAARYPERVSHLILWSAYAQASDWTQLPQAQALLKVLDTDWETYTEALAHAGMHWLGGDVAHRYAAVLREGVTQTEYKAWIDALPTFDVTGVLSEVAAPTLVLQPRASVMPRIDVAMNLASRIPNARLVVLEGMSAARSWATRTVASAIDEFLTEGEEAAAPEAASSGLVTILFTDMESSTALRQRLGDAKAQELVRTHNTLVREALRAHGGSEIKHTGDGIMASLPTASGALECAIAIQRGVAAHVEQHPGTPLGVYIGLNAGEPIAEEKDLFGTSVDLARRICDHAEPGEIVVSDVVRQLAAGKGFLFADRGDVELRGFEDPVRLYEVRWQEEG